MPIVQKLIPLLNSRNGGERKQAEKQIVAAGARIVPALLPILEDKKGRQPIEMRAAVARVLGKIGSPDAIEPLRRTLRKTAEQLADELEPSEMKKRQENRDFIAGIRFSDPNLEAAFSKLSNKDVATRRKALLAELIGALTALGHKPTAEDLFASPAGMPDRHAD